MSIVQLDDFSLQTLQALCQYEIDFPFDDDVINDTDVFDSGQILFGNDWGGVKKRCKDSYDYAPTVSMRLGLLNKRGYVHKRATEENYSIWSVSPAGLQVLIAYGLVNA